MALPTISKAALQQVVEATHPVANIVTTKLITVEDSAVHIANLLMTMQNTEFTAPFDWQSEFEDRREHLEDPDVIQSADLEELRMIMTSHVRIDRMSHGHLHRLIENGYWNICMVRAAELHAQMQDD